MTGPSDGESLRRRAVLGTLAGGASAATAGCLRRARSIAGWGATEQVSLQIKTLPADSDPYVLRAARQIAAWYTAAGIDAQVVPVSEEELLRQVLLGTDFDAFLSRSPHRGTDPDALYSLLHSRFADTQGWQNPFGFVDLDVDELLETQRRATGDRRREAVAEIQRSIARSQPFTTLTFPDDIRAVRRDTYTNWRAADLQSSQGYLQLQRATDTASTADTEPTLRIATTDRRATENLNPLSVEYRRTGAITGLVYDALGVDAVDGVSPWLAASWAFDETDAGPRATVRVRPEATWHDGEPLTAADVAFTYALLADTSLDAAGDDTETDRSARVPAPRFQGRVDLVADIEATERTLVRFQFVDCSPRVATRAFTVPILPEHVWADRTEPASMAGIEVGRVTEALVTNNIPPVGSGPLQFVRNTPRDSLVLESFEEHFLVGENPDADAVTAPPYDRLALQVVGSDDAAIGVVANGDADLTGTPVGADTVPRIGRTDGLELVVRRSETPYLLGYNTRSPPLTNPRFRHVLARLVDRAHLTTEVFDGYARPTESPLGSPEWVPAELQWNDTGATITPFLGSDGEVDVQQAREAFRDAGFQYDDGRLLRGT